MWQTHDVLTKIFLKRTIKSGNTRVGISQLIFKITHANYQELKIWNNLKDSAKRVYFLFIFSTVNQIIWFLKKSYA